MSTTETIGDFSKILTKIGNFDVKLHRGYFNSIF